MKLSNYDKLKIGVYSLGMLLTLVEVIENGKGTFVAHAVPFLVVIPILVLIMGAIWCVIDVLFELSIKDLTINYKIHGIGILSNIVFSALLIFILYNLE